MLALLNLPHPHLHHLMLVSRILWVAPHDVVEDDIKIL